MLTLIFTRSNTLIGKIIQLITRSKWTHVAVLDGDNVIEASGRKGKVVQTDLKEFVESYSEIEYRSLPGDISIIRQSIGTEYDYNGIRGFILLWIRHDTDKLFCSEKIALASTRATVRDQADKVSPAELYRWSDAICA